MPEPVKRAAVHHRIAHDATPRHIRLPRLELRLDQDERLPAALGEGEDRRQNGPDADEGDVAGDELRRERQLGEVPRVRPLEHRHALVRPHARIELTVADVHCDHPGRAALEQAVREATGRRPDIDAVEAGDVEPQNGEGVVELLPSARDEARRLLDRERGGVLHLHAGLLEAGDAAREHERLRLRAALGETALDQENVEAYLHSPSASAWRRAFASSASTCFAISASSVMTAIASSLFSLPDTRSSSARAFSSRPRSSSARLSESSVVMSAPPSLVRCGRESR